MKIIAIKELQNTTNIVKMARASCEPIFVTKNGYGELVVMAQECYSRMLARFSIDEKLAIAEASYANGAKLIDGEKFFTQMENEYGF